MFAVAMRQAPVSSDVQGAAEHVIARKDLIVAERSSTIRSAMRII